MACLWRCSPGFSVSMIVLVENMCIMLISTGGFDLVLVNVYLKSDIWETHTLADYLENLNKMENILRDFSFDSIFFIGDFNADPFLGRSWHNLKHFMQCNSLKCYDVDQLPDDTFTFIKLW